MTRKFTAAILAALLAVSITACSTAPDSTGSDTPSSPSGSTAGTTAPLTPLPEPTEKDPAVPNEEQPEELVLADNDRILFKITAMENDPVWGYALKVHIENRTDKELLFTVDDVSINRYMCDPFWAESVGAGMKSNSTINWFESSLEENSITDVKEIRFTLRVYDANDFFAEDVLLESFTITP